MIIRQMQESDLPVVAAAEADIFSDAWSSVGVEGCFRMPTVRAYVAAGEFGDSAIFDEQFAESERADGEGELAGYAFLSVSADEGELLNLAVKPKFRRRGYARELLETVITDAAEAGAASLWLEVRSGNLPARSLYESVGFEEMGVRRGYYPPEPGRKQKEDAVVMRLDLTAIAEVM